MILAVLGRLRGRSCGLERSELPVAPDSSHGQAINLSCLSALGFLRPPITDRRSADGRAVQPGQAQAIAFPAVPASPEYKLTDLGRGVARPLAQLRDWMEATLPGSRP